MPSPDKNNDGATSIPTSTPTSTPPSAPTSTPPSAPTPPAPSTPAKLQTMQSPAGTPGAAPTPSPNSAAATQADLQKLQHGIAADNEAQRKKSKEEEEKRMQQDPIGTLMAMAHNTIGKEEYRNKAAETREDLSTSEGREKLFNSAKEKFLNIAEKFGVSNRQSALHTPPNTQNPQTKTQNTATAASQSTPQPTQASQSTQASQPQQSQIPQDPNSTPKPGS